MIEKMKGYRLEELEAIANPKQALRFLAFLSHNASFHLLFEDDHPRVSSQALISGRAPVQPIEMRSIGPAAAALAFGSCHLPKLAGGGVVGSMPHVVRSKSCSLASPDRGGRGVFGGEAIREATGKAYTGPKPCRRPEGFFCIYRVDSVVSCDHVTVTEGKGADRLYRSLQAVNK
jgi:hypothetical protein